MNTLCLPGGDSKARTLGKPRGGGSTEEPINIVPGGAREGSQKRPPVPVYEPCLYSARGGSFRPCAWSPSSPFLLTVTASLSRL